MRLFTAIRLSQEAEKAVNDLQHRLKQEANFSRWQPLNNMHITLHFLGEVDVSNVDSIKEAVRRATSLFSPFTLRLGRLGAFPNENRPRILWMGLEGEMSQLSDMQKKIGQELRPLGYVEDKPSYRPHITLAREPKEQLSPDLFHQVESTVSWQVRQVYLYRSELASSGAVHTIIEEFPLSK